MIVSNNRTLLSLLALSMCILLSNCSHEAETQSPTQNKISVAKQQNPELWPQSTIIIDSDEAKINQILAAMSLEDKVGQLVMAEIRHVTPQDVERYKLGGILNGGGAFPKNNMHANAAEWVELADEFYQASINRNDGQPKIPVIWGTDAVHGHNNVFGATIFPHNIGLGATANVELMREIGTATAKEVSATGIYWTFAPSVGVPMDDRWGRTYEGFAEDPQLVAKLSAAMIEGLQGTVGESFLDQDRIIATAKHFIGDGGTEFGIDQGDTVLSEADLSKFHGQAYFSAMDKGVQTVMATFNRWNGKKIHGEHYLLTEVLKNKMGFDGLVVGDWNGHGQVDGCTNDSCAQAINAGVDMIMVPENWEAFYKNTLKQVRDNDISESRLDDAVKRILRVKLRLGMFDDKGPKSRIGAGDQSLIGHKTHREIARQAVRESLVLLKNNSQTLPLAANTKVLVVGEAAESMANQLGGWSMTWQGTETKNSDFPGATRIVDGIKTAVEEAGGEFSYSKNGSYITKPDVAIVILAEPPYAEGPGDRKNLAFSPENRKHIAIMQNLQKQGISIVTVFLSGRAMWVTPELNASDAFVAAWLPGTEGQGVADVLFCEKGSFSVCGFKGKSSFSWPKTPYQEPQNINNKLYDPLFEFAYGLEYGQKTEIDSLQETSDQTNQTSLGKLLFKGRGIPPFKATIQEENTSPILASQSISKTKNSGVITTIFDREVQEDAQRISFGGNGLNSWKLQSDKHVNWLAEAQQDAVLALDVKVLNAPKEAFNVAMLCGEKCKGGFDISDTLSKPIYKNWQSIGLPLACLDKNGVNLENISHPIAFLSSGAWSIEISNIRLLDANDKPDHILCN